VPRGVGEFDTGIPMRTWETQGEGKDRRELHAADQGGLEQVQRWSGARPEWTHKFFPARWVSST